ncbi:O-linked N-acetylglucosamine transferase, SPINDLY family protein [Caballeronia grimmiae]|uniref:O-linked N-acetylglucosamine transferase, SPINDLY family protein n=1 Tax=Caballeronia grimmiae TaxID=1071679 RepID=UPI0038BB79B5
MLSADANFIHHLRLAWRGELELFPLFDYAGQLDQAGQRELAAALYQTWLARNNTPDDALVYFNLGAMLSGLGDDEGARAAYVRAIELRPSLIQPHFNLGLIYERLGQTQLALAEWLYVANRASADNEAERPLLRLALNNLGRVHENNRQYADALTFLTRSLALDPVQPDVLHHWIFLRAKQCVWPVYAPLDGVDPDLMRRSTSALAMISLSDNPEEQLAAARRYVDKKLDLNVPALAPTETYGHRKIRIAYMSSDFCLHPVAMLTAELFELHDRERVEVFGYCWSREDGSDMRARIVNSMDYFRRIHDLSDEAAARLIREDEIDVLIDLQGQTLGARPGVLAYRPAPIQITYLGLPATTGLPFIDYVIADRFLIPEDHARFYSEQPLYMPDIYQVSDRKRVSNPVPSRKECGLPEDGFVFCSFSNNFKYTPELFAVWMDILRRVPDSVLWLLADNPWAEVNLREEAKKHGMDDRRLIFGSRVTPATYLARYATADLFLDSYPFNAGTTANDALWMGLPVLTCSGRTFASRMAGALLSAAGMPELITDNFRDYKEKAVALAQAPEEVVRLREKLKLVKRNGVLFDTQRFARNLENRLIQLAREKEVKPLA